MDRERWAFVVDPFIETLRGFTFKGAKIDVRENVAFFGKGEQTRFIHDRFPDAGCAIAIEFKKIFMDEWTGRPDREAIREATRDARSNRPSAGEDIVGNGMKPQRDAATQSIVAVIGQDLAELVSASKPIRRELPDGGRLHIDRPLPFLFVHIGSEPIAARDVVSSNASYLLAADAALAVAICRLISKRLTKHCQACLLLDFGELEKDRFLTDDAPLLPPFEIAVATGSSPAERAAKEAFAAAAVDRVL